MLIAAVVSPAAAEALRSLPAQHTLGYISTRERGTEAAAADLEAAAQATADALVLDVAAGPPEALVQGLRRYRTARPGVRVILLAAGRQPGDPLVSALVNLGVYDIVAPADPAALGAALAGALDRPPATYADAARWHQATLTPADGQQKAPPKPPERWRVLSGGNRPYLIAIAGIIPFAGATDLSWHLAVYLARQGLCTSLLLDMSADIVTAARRQYVPPGLPLTVHSHDRPALEHRLQSISNWDHPRMQALWPRSRLRRGLQPEERADIVVVDLGPLEKAREQEPDLLAAADQVVLCWPGLPLRFLVAADAMKNTGEDRDRLLQRAVHCCYCARPGITEALRSVIAKLIGTEGPPIAVGVPSAADGPDLQPLLDVLAPWPGRRHPPTLALIRVGVGRCARHIGKGRRRWVLWPAAVALLYMVVRLYLGG